MSHRSIAETKVVKEKTLPIRSGAAPRAPARGAHAVESGVTERKALSDDAHKLVPRTVAPVSYIARSNWCVAAALAVAGLLVYANSFQTPLVFDSLKITTDIPTLNLVFTEPWLLLATNRPVLVLSFSVDRSLFNDTLWGFHLTSLVIHVLASIVLFLVVRRTIERSHGVSEWLRNLAVPLAFAISLLWLVHPLQTQSVTYLWQRSESLMGLFYLLTLYCFIRAQDSPRAVAWYAASTLCFFLGLGTKEIAVTAPLLVLWYDRAFLARSWQEILGNRWGYYLPVFAATALLVLGVLWLHREWYAAGGVLEAEGVTTLGFARTQPEIVLHYLRLVLWPSGQCLDYAWRISEDPARYIPASLAVASLLALTVWAAWKRPMLGFLGGAFFLILAPTSSLVVVGDLAFEHRMYLPLAPLSALCVLGAATLAHRIAPRPAAAFLLGAVALAAVGLGLTTHLRNYAYASEITAWEDIVAKSPHNARGYANLGASLGRAGRYAEALPTYAEALRQFADKGDRSFAELHYNYGLALWKTGRPHDAIPPLRQAIAMKPECVDPYLALGNALAATGEGEEALTHYERAVELAPDSALARFNLGCALSPRDAAAAILHFRKAVALKPDYAEAHYNLANTLAHLGDGAQAIAHYERVLELAPDHAAAGHNLAAVRASLLPLP